MIPARLQWYVLREMLRVALISAVALTAVIFVGMSLSLMRRGLNILQVYDALPFAAAMSLPYALPCAFLLGSVFVFGRLSGGNEITAMRCSGVNLNTVIFPPLLLALMVCAGTFGLNHYLLPWSLNRVRNAGATVVADYLGSLYGTRLQKIGRFSIYVGSVDERTRVWRDVAVIEFRNSFPLRVIRAREGSFSMADQDRLIILDLKGVDIYHPRLNESEKEKPGHFGALRLPISPYADDDKERPEVRPKFLKLTELVKFRAELRRKVAAVRKSGGYAGVRRPKSSRKEMQRQKDRAYRDLNALKREQANHRGVLQRAIAALSQAQAAVASAQAMRDQLAQQSQEAQLRLDDLKKQIEELAAQSRELAEVEGPLQEDAQQRLERIEQESASLTKQAAGMEERLGEVKGQLEKAQAQLADAAAKRDARLSEEKEASEPAEEHDKEVRAADAKHTELRKRWNNLRNWEMLLEADSEFHQRNAGSLATFLFVLMGIPLGILSRRGNVIMAFLLSFGAVLAIYYPLAMIAQMLDADAFLPAHIAEWMPSAAVGVMGLGLMIWGVRR